MTVAEKHLNLKDQLEQRVAIYNKTAQQINELQKQQQALTQDIIGLCRAIQEIEDLLPAKKEKKDG